MKTPILFIRCAVVALALQGFNAAAAPGTVVFANHNGSKVLNGHTSSPITTNATVRIALYWSPLGTNNFIMLGAYTNVGVPVPGIFAGGTRTCGAATAGGSTGQFRVRAWSGSATNYEQALGTPGVLIGQSPVIQVVTGNPGGDPPMAPASLLSGGLSGFSLLTNVSPPMVVNCPTNKTVACGTVWSFDLPTTSGGCISNPVIAELSTATNGQCPQLITRTWQVTDGCTTNSCSQIVTVVDNSPPLVLCATDKVVSCATNWAFDFPTVTSGVCGPNSTATVLGTITNNFCPQMITRTWGITNTCNGTSTLCAQTVTVLCPDCPVLAVAKVCPPNPVPPGGILSFIGTVTNLSGLTLSNVTVRSDQPTANTLVHGPITLASGAGAAFAGSYTVSAVDCGAYTNTLTAFGTGPGSIVFSNSTTAACPRATVITPGDRNGDGIVDQGELNAVLANYWPSSPWLRLTNIAGLGGTNITFALSNSTAGAFSVEFTTNLTHWQYLGPATPRYEFTDTNAPALPQRFYRLRWP